MIHTIRHYLHYYLYAKTKFKVHSPIVYELINNLYGNRKIKIPEIEQVRKDLRSNSRIIVIEDYGAGSRYRSDKNRSIKTIAKSAVSNKRKCQVLAQIINHFQPKSILELGTSLGISTAYISKTQPTASILTIEGSSAVAAVANETFEALSLTNIKQIVDTIENTLPQLEQSNQKFDLIYADGNHTESATKEYFEWFLKLTDPNCVVILDDIYWSKGMTDAWRWIKEHPNVTQTIDLFTFGIVLFTPDFKVKEHHRLINHKLKPFQFGFLK